MREQIRLIARGGILPPRWTLLLLRLAFGWLFLNSAVEKLTTEGGWTAAGFLTHAVEGPFATIFQRMAGLAWVDWMVVTGELLIGVALVLGVATRLTVLSASVMLLLFYLAQLPPEHGWVSEKIIYILGLNVLAVARAGTFLGLDQLLEKLERRYPALQYALG
ncbi:MAG: DoxX family protein [Dehalococcoidia bacterium]